MNNPESAGHWQQQPLPWQMAALDQLGSRLMLNQLPHALLITGAQGLGKTLFAESLAALILCAAPVDNRACGRCESCCVAQGGGHGDYRWLAPPPDKRAIGIDAVRSVLSFVQKTAGYGRYKVLVVAPAEAMTTGAANALLKTLEEPAGNSVLLLVSHRPSDLAATVRSRCQQVILPTPAAHDAAAWLKDSLASAGFERSPETILHALDAANNRPLAAFNLVTSDTLDGVHAQMLLIQGLIAGRVSVAEANSGLGAESPEALLTAVYHALAAQLGKASAADLTRLGPPLVSAIDMVVKMLAAVRAGVNPAKDILYGEVCRKIAGIFPAR